MHPLSPASQVQEKQIQTISSGSRTQQQQILSKIRYLKKKKKSVMSTHCHSRNEGMHKAVVCSTMSTHTELPGSVVVCCVLSGFLGQEVEHMDLVAIA